MAMGVWGLGGLKDVYGARVGVGVYVCVRAFRGVAVLRTNRMCEVDVGRLELFLILGAMDRRIWWGRGSVRLGIKLFR
jgi:hypothetical protein